MKKSTPKQKYTKGDIGKFRVVPDFLPPPHLLVPKDDSVKVTLSLSRQSLDFIKVVADENQVPYQRMIRNLLDRYAHQYQSPQHPR